MSFFFSRRNNRNDIILIGAILLIAVVGLVYLFLFRGRGDTVKVIAGKDKGKEGKVTVVMPSKNKVIVEGVAMVKKHQKARAQGQESAIVTKEAAIDASNVMRICSKCGKAARVGSKVLENGKKVRIAMHKKCGYPEI